MKTLEQIFEAPALPSDPWGGKPGAIHFANEQAMDVIRDLANSGNNDAASLSEPLNQYMVGYRDPENLEEILETIAPSVPTGRRFEYKVSSERKDFMVDGDDIKRPIPGDFKVVNSHGSTENGRTYNKGLVYILDEDEDGMEPQVQQRIAASLRNRILRSEIKLAIGVLDANDNSTSANWGPANSAANPHGDLLSMVDSSGDKRGINPTLVVMGGGAAVKRKMCLLGKADPDSAGAYLTDEELADFLGVDRVLTLKARYQSSVSAKSKLLGDDIYAYYARRDLTKDDPSNLKRFVKLTDAGLFKVHVIPKLKRVLIAVECYSDIICTSKLGIEKFTASFTS